MALTKNTIDRLAKIRLALMILATVFILTIRMATALHAAETTEPARWWKGNLHTHSFWSDGTDFPEMIAKWYRDRDYNFLALSDHNILSRGERWMDLKTIESRAGAECMKKYRNAFGDDWVVTRENNKGMTQVRLKPLNEFRGQVEAPNQFIMIEGEEISDSVARLPIHLNATNLQDLLPPVGGTTVREAIDNNLRAAEEQAKKYGRDILVHLNHPNFGWAITAEDLAWVTRERFVEVYNGHPSVNHLGDANHPSVARLWDIANTLRIDQLDAPPLFGLGTDDSHEYHGRPGSRPGRAWVMVRADELNAAALIQAMYRGDFYASSGVVMSTIDFDPEQKVLSLKIDADEDVQYETAFIGTRKDYDKSSKQRTDGAGKPLPVTKIYSSDIGQVLAKSSSSTPSYTFQGDELYVRAVITSSRRHPDPSFENQFEQAWTQPVGWKK